MIEVPIAIKTAPFMIAGVIGAQQINKTRVVEAVVTAAVSGAVIAMAGYYVAFPVLQEQVAQIRRDVAETKETIKDVRESIDTRGSRRDAKEAIMEERVRQLQIEMARARK